MTEPIAHLAIPAKDLKMLRESLCLATTSISGYSFSTYNQMKAIDQVINEIDRHRPLGSNGKHGKLHTATCGCEDK